MVSRDFPAPPPPFSVLFVDDEPDTVEGLCAIAEIHGWRAMGAHSGKEALALLVRESFHVVVIDLAMPAMTGIELARQIGLLRLSSEPELIAFTGVTHQIVWISAEKEGFSRRFLKPDCGATLIRYLQRLARKHPAPSCPTPIAA